MPSPLVDVSVVSMSRTRWKVIVPDQPPGRIGVVG
jgi:hypothetical protein